MYTSFPFPHNSSASDGGRELLQGKRSRNDRPRDVIHRFLAGHPRPVTIQDPEIIIILYDGNRPGMISPFRVGHGTRGNPCDPAERELRFPAFLNQLQVSKRTQLFVAFGMALYRHQSGIRKLPDLLLRHLIRIPDFIRHDKDRRLHIEFLQ